MSDKHGGRCFATLIKILISGLLAFAALTLFCCLYYNIPAHFDDVSGATDYKWKPGTFYSRGTEGFALGRINNDGFNDPFDYRDDMDISTLIMGSSHMEAFQVGQRESTAAKLGELIKDGTVYSIGVSGHSLLTCIRNLDKAMEKYKPSDCVVIETGSIYFSDEDLRAAVDGTLPEIPSHSGGIVGLLQRNQYLRLLYMQFSNYKDSAEADTGAGTGGKASKVTDVELKQALVEKLIQKASAAASSRGVRVIILYHPGLTVGSHGELRTDADLKMLEIFKKSCAGNGVEFLDMTERFRREYLNDYLLPYGFSNSPAGTGHLNKYGHAMAADELYKLISGMN